MPELTDKQIHEKIVYVRETWASQSIVDLTKIVERLMRERDVAKKMLDIIEREPMASDVLDWREHLERRARSEMEADDAKE